MALYLGSSKELKIKLNDGNSFRLNIPTIITNPSVNAPRLLASDGYILKDSNGLYLLAKEGK